MHSSSKENVSVSRRTWIQHSAVCSAALGVVGSRVLRAEENSPKRPPQSVPPEDYCVVNGRARQSVMAWCFNPMPAEKLIVACAKMGLAAVEGIDKKHYPLMKKNGLGISICGSHGFARGPVSLENHSFCVEKLRAGVDLAAQWGSPGVITFTGMREAGITDRQAQQNCIDCWKTACAYAERQGVNIVLEMLNTRDDSHPMKGHPGYFGDDLELCLDMIRAVDSPRMKLLFDVYHVQIMHGDVIRRFRECREYVAHVHTAGNPGRAELDDSQELNYPAIIRAMLDTGFDGYIAQEFIPTWDDPLAALRHAVKTCDV